MSRHNDKFKKAFEKYKDEITSIMMSYIKRQIKHEYDDHESTGCLCSKHRSENQHLLNNESDSHQNASTQTETTVGKHKCKFCYKNFSRPFVLKQHIKSVHDQLKDYKCDLCGKYFSRYVWFYIKWHYNNFWSHEF